MKLDNFKLQLLHTFSKYYKLFRLTAGHLLDGDLDGTHLKDSSSGIMATKDAGRDRWPIPEEYSATQGDFEIQGPCEEPEGEE